MKYGLTWVGLLALITGLWLLQRLKRRPGVETFEYPRDRTQYGPAREAWFATHR